MVRRNDAQVWDSSLILPQMYNDAVTDKTSTQCCDW